MNWSEFLFRFFLSRRTNYVSGKKRSHLCFILSNQLNSRRRMILAMKASRRICLFAVLCTCMLAYLKKQQERQSKVYEEWHTCNHTRSYILHIYPIIHSQRWAFPFQGFFSVSHSFQKFHSQLSSVSEQHSFIFRRNYGGRKRIQRRKIMSLCLSCCPLQLLHSLKRQEDQIGLQKKMYASNSFLDETAFGGKHLVKSNCMLCVSKLNAVDLKAYISEHKHTHTRSIMLGHLWIVVKEVHWRT